MNYMQIAIYRPGRISYRYTESVTDSTSAPLFIELNDKPTLIVVQPGINAKVQYSISHPDTVTAGGGIWLDWSAGVVTALTGSSIDGAITALRLVSTGTSSWEVAK